MSNPIIKVKNLSKKINKRDILQDVSFEIEKNSLVSLIGPNGAGKSTLVKILLGFDPEYEGDLEINGIEKIAYIPQINIRDPHPVPLSVREYILVRANSLYNHKKVTESDLEEILNHVGVSADRLDHSFWNLSGGERQRVAIARALLSDPEIMVLDEPLSAVDFSSRKNLYELIRHLQQDHSITVLLVSHDVDSVLPISDRVLCLNKTLHSSCHPCDYSADTFNKAPTIHHKC